MKTANADWSWVMSEEIRSRVIEGPVLLYGYGKECKRLLDEYPDLVGLIAGIIDDGVTSETSLIVDNRGIPILPFLQIEKFRFANDRAIHFVITTIAFARRIENNLQMVGNRYSWFSILSYSRTLRDERTILERNETRWKMLPDDAHILDVSSLSRLDDDDLLDTYREVMQRVHDDRGDEYRRNEKLLEGRSILELGSGLGFDGFFLGRYVLSWTFSDIVPQNIALLQRLAKMFGDGNYRYESLSDIFNHPYQGNFSGLYAHGVLHHLPFELAKRQLVHLDRFLIDDTIVVVLMYPKERWLDYGEPSFEEFGILTDGLGTPWAEWYDLDKIADLFGPAYAVENQTMWGGASGHDFVSWQMRKIPIGCRR